MLRTTPCATALVVATCAVAAPEVAASEQPPRACGAACSVAPPMSPREFLELVGVLPTPGVADIAAVRRARCANPEAAAEGGDCPPPRTLGGGGGGGPLMMRLRG